MQSFFEGFFTPASNYEPFQMGTLMFILAAVGASFIISESYIFKDVREVISQRSETAEEGIRCPQCMGFWTGMAFEIIRYFTTDHTCINAPLWLSMTVMGLAVSAVCTIVISLRR